jgi:NarL family two-component system response regulator LiaR
MTQKCIRILIADDHQILRGGLQAIIDFEGDMEVVGHAADGIEAVELYRLLKPDVVIMDLFMPKKDGIEASCDIAAEDPQAHILVLTSFSDTDQIKLAMRAGVMGYILKNTLPEDLIHAIRKVYNGQISIQPAILQQLARDQEKKNDDTPEKLTIREYEVLKMLALGLNNDDIADQLSISKRTVNAHITNLKSKLNLSNRAQITLYALSHGVLGLFPGEK